MLNSYFVLKWAGIRSLVITLMVFLLAIYSYGENKQSDPVNSPSIRVPGQFYYVDSPVSLFNPAMPGVGVNISQRDRLAFSVGGGVEYGNVDEIFEVVDRVSSYLQDLDQSPDEPDIPVLDPDEPVQLPSDITLKEILDNSPEFNEWMAVIQNQAVKIASAFAVISQESYAKTFLDSGLVVALSDDILGGKMYFSVGHSSYLKAVGFVDVFDFDRNTAISELTKLKDIQPTDPLTDIFLSDDIKITVDPSSGDVRLKVVNDSLMLFQSASVQKFGLGWTFEAGHYKGGQLTLGVKPKVYIAGLSQVDARFGDISNSEDLFDDMRNADYREDKAIGVDFGVAWQSRNLAAGVSFNDAFKPEFDFPEIDFSRYTKSNILTELKSRSSFYIDRKILLDGSIYTADNRWRLSGRLDGLSHRSPVGDDIRWVGIQGQYQPQNLWLPRYRLGLQSNLVGSELTYVSLGISYSFISLDLASTLDKVKASGRHLPRGLFGSLAFNIRF